MGRLPAQHYCTFHKHIHKYKIQNTKYKIQCMPDDPHNITAPSTNTSTNTKYKIQNTNTKYKIQNTKSKIQNTNTKYKVCPITRTTLLHLPQIHPQIQIQNTKYNYEIRCMPDYPHNITAPSTNTKHKTEYTNT